MITKDKRDKIEELIYDFLSIVDVNSKFKNRTYYEDMFDMMTIEQFDDWVKDIGKTMEDTIVVHQSPFEAVSLKQIEAAADFLDVPLQEYVYYRHLVDGVEVRTKHKVPVGYVNVKRLQQLLSKKNQFTFDTRSVDYATGEVRGKSRVHHISKDESYMLLLQNSKETLRELYGARGSNMDQKKYMQNKIATDGWVSSKDMPANEGANDAVNTLDMYIIASGLRSDLLFNNTNDYKTPFTKEKLLRELARKR